MDLNINKKINRKSDQFGSALKRVRGINEVNIKLNKRIETILVIIFLN